MVYLVTFNGSHPTDHRNIIAAIQQFEETIAISQYCYAISTDKTAKQVLHVIEPIPGKTSIYVLGVCKPVEGDGDFIAGYGDKVSHTRQWLDSHM